MPTLCHDRNMGALHLLRARMYVVGTASERDADTRFVALAEDQIESRPWSIFGNSRSVEIFNT